VAPFIALISDNNKDLATYVSAIPAAVSVPILTETGTLQDLTPLMGPNGFPGFGPVTVQVQSDVTPEPSALVLVALGAVSTLIARRRLSVR
jgi:hypothetical protein